MLFRLFILLFVFIPFAHPATAAPQVLDANLRLALSSAQKQAEDIHCLVQVRDDGRALEAWMARVGGRVRSAHGDVRVVTLPTARLADLAQLPSVAWAEADAPLRPRLDVARGAGGVNVDGLNARRSADARPALTGKGVLVGIVDGGFDTALPVLKDANGRTRIVALWDQKYTGSGGSAPSVAGRTLGGRVFSAADIDSGVYRNVDADSHGTNVASCAAGVDAKYAGVAPDASLLCVASESKDLSAGSGTGDTLDAVAWMMGEARRLNRPLVVNLSLGASFGPHDGTTLFEQALQADVDAGLIACVSAGNAADQAVHARAVAAAGGMGEVRLRLNDTGAGYDALRMNSVDMWFDAGVRPTLTVTRYTDESFGTPVGTTVTIPFEAEGTYTDPSKTFTVEVKKELPYRYRGVGLRNRFLLVIHALTGQPGFYLFHVGNTGAADFSFDAYIQGHDDLPNVFSTESAFLSAVSSDATVEVPGTTPGVITVGAYANRAVGARAAGSLSPFSSRGPLFDGAGLYRGLDAYKPDVCAPGEAVIVARSTAVGGGFKSEEGTSIAAPLVAGMIALILQENPAAKPADVKRILQQSCRRDDFTGAVPNFRWGYGKIDADRALALVVSPRPRIDAVVRESATRVHVKGADIARSSAVIINGQRVPDTEIEWDDDDDVFVTVDPALVLHEVTVENVLGEAGQKSATLSLDSASASLGVGGAGSSSVPPGGGCFIATAAYGSYLDPHVVVLRRFRDRWLLTWSGGRVLVSLYYAASPPLAAVIAGHPWLRLAVRLILTPLVVALTYPLAWVLVLALAAAGVARRRRLHRFG